MKRPTFTLKLFVFCLVPLECWGMSINDIVFRDGLYFQKFSDVPFTGQLDEGLIRGSIKDGKRIGQWVEFWENGQLRSKGNYKNDQFHGHWVRYHENGELDRKRNYRNGVLDGPSISYFDNGQLGCDGSFKDGENHGEWTCYYRNGQLESKSSYINGKLDGVVVTYETDGTVAEYLSGTYKNGRRIK